MADRGVVDVTVAFKAGDPLYHEIVEQLRDPERGWLWNVTTVAGITAMRRYFHADELAVLLDRRRIADPDAGFFAGPFTYQTGEVVSIVIDGEATNYRIASRRAGTMELEKVPDHGYDANENKVQVGDEVLYAGGPNPNSLHHGTVTGFVEMGGSRCVVFRDARGETHRRYPEHIVRYGAKVTTP